MTTLKRYQSIIACTLLMAAPVQAQDTTRAGSAAARDTTRRATAAGANRPAAQPADSARKFEMSEMVRFPNGEAIEGATVIVRPAADSARARARVAVTNARGVFTIDTLRAGNYIVQVSRPGVPGGYDPRIAFDGSPIGDIIVPVNLVTHTWWTIALLLGYVVLIMLSRWHHIGKSIDEMLYSQIAALSTRLQTEVDDTFAGSNARVSTLREQVAELQKRRSRNFIEYISDFFFWSRGRENAKWVTVHEVERQLTAFLAPPEYVTSYLHWADGRLRLIGSAPAIALADTIRAELEKSAASTADEIESQRKTRKAMLGRAISQIYEDRDTNFATMMEWHNKASWLIAAALIIIAALSASVGNSVIFLAGAAGGFSSRVMRALKREDVPLDYGASWTTLFLSPVFGALAAWFGIALITLATSSDLELLGDAFNAVNWYMPMSPATLAIAFMLGFSERFFDAVVGAVDRHAETAAAADRAALIAGAAAPMAGAKPATAAAGAPPSAPAQPVSEARGIKLKLPKEPVIPVQTVSGAIVLAQPATAVTAVSITTDNAEYVPTPGAITIAAGATEGRFDIVPKGDPASDTVRVTAKISDLTLSADLEFK